MNRLASSTYSREALGSLGFSQVLRTQAALARLVLGPGHCLRTGLTGRTWPQPLSGGTEQKALPRERGWVIEAVDGRSPGNPAASLWGGVFVPAKSAGQLYASETDKPAQSMSGGWPLLRRPTCDHRPPGLQGTPRKPESNPPLSLPMRNCSRHLQATGTFSDVDHQVPEQTLGRR